MKDFNEKLRRAVAGIQAGDRKLADELEEVRDKNRGSGGLESMSAGLEGLEGFEGFDSGLETIVLRTGRPVLAIFDGEPKLEFRDTDSEVWRERLTKARDGIAHAINAVGRIELENNPRFDWVGTGWLIDEDIVVTNRHVAGEFARTGGSGFVFRNGPFGTMRASIDFLEEIDNPATYTFVIQKVLHIEPEGGPDLAFVQVKPDPGRKLAAPVLLSSSTGAPQDQVAVIGYPARDSRIPEADLMEDIFGNVYNKKRLAPGQLIVGGDGVIQHDCSTLGGNSGSVVLGLQSGEALGLHFSGRFLEANFAVSAALVADRLARVKGSESRGLPALPPKHAPTARAEPQSPTPGDRNPTATATTPGEITFQVPLTISVRLGAPASITTMTTSSPAATVSVTSAAADTEADEQFDEGRVEDYADREGYQSDFLGHGIDVPLPVVESDDILTFDDRGETTSELKYTHFSVVMNQKRRMCFYSAVNINGKKARKAKRGPWKIDPRIDEGLQIIKECYGNEPKFARGHMTRREDPIWGTEDEAVLGNKDSMHVTNVTPQMQPFNAGIWLALESYALDHTRDDKMSICVFTGPFFAKNDPIKYGVKIPVTFWKVIAFIHDETGELAATGYTMSQKAFLREEEFVFGQHETNQVPISLIENRAGIDFGPLRDCDPLAQAEESMPTALTAVSQIRWR